MVSNIDLTASEQTVLDQARLLLGESLATFLFSGLGQSSISHRRCFTAHMTGDGEQNVQAFSYRFEMVNDSTLGLPIGRDPLVMALLLNLLREEMRMNDRVDFDVNNILKTFGWAHTPESQLLVRQAVERYFLTTYRLINPTVSKEESLTRFRKLLISYETVSRPLSIEATEQQTLMKVQFFPHFIYHIYTQRKSLLEIYFHQLEQMQEVPC